MKKRVISLVFIMLFVLSFVLTYVNVPDTLILYKDREWENGNVLKLMNLDKSVEASGSALVPRRAGDYSASASIFGIPYKSVKMTVLDADEVVLGGQAVGIRLYSDGLVVVAVGRVNENKKSPAEAAGIKVGDVIFKVNGQKVGSPDNFVKIIEESEGEITLEVRREEEEKSFTLCAEKSDTDGVKRIGLWVRDSTAGVGTMTYMSEEEMKYGALGHGISEADTGVRFEVLEGSIEECSINGIEKGEKGDPGELKGLFYTGARLLGSIEKNEEEGIFGKLKEKPVGDKVKLGLKSEIKRGEAYIRTSLDGKEVREYRIEIKRVSPNSKTPGKGLVIEVTDPELIEKTGGIVQGMSGSPIIQDGKLIGAVTHVLVNDPKKGYGIFIENMLKAGSGF